MLITKYTSLLVQSTSKQTAMVSPTYYRGVGGAGGAGGGDSGPVSNITTTSTLMTSITTTCHEGTSGDAFLEPYMQGLGNDFGNVTSDGDIFQNENTISHIFGGKARRPSSYGRENTEDQIIPLLGSPAGVDFPDTPISETGFKLMRMHNDGGEGGSQASLNQQLTTDGDDYSLGSGDSINSSVVSEEETPCDITLLERLIRSHPIWFLPGIQRAGAFHLLQGKEDGNFVVRQSSQTSTMAISVRLPNGRGPYIEHYLIQGASDGQIGLESSDNKFTSIPLLIAHYCQCCDELPVQLTLPRAIREAKNRQQLSSLALLGQEFWRYPMANPRPSLRSDEELSPSPIMHKSSPNNDLTPRTDSVFSSSSNSPASSLSSFDSGAANGTTNSIFEIQNTMTSSPLNETCSSQPLNNNSLMSTFKGSPPPVGSSIPHNQIGIPIAPEELPMETSQNAANATNNSNNFGTMVIRKPRPTPPNSLNLISTIVNTTTASSVPPTTNFNPASSCPAQLQQPSVISPTSKTPPPPPPRWTKPNSTPSSGPTSLTTSNHQQNFTVTTTLTFSVNNKDPAPSPQVQVSCVQISPPVTNKTEIECSQSTSTTLNRSVQTSHTSFATSTSSSCTQTPQILSPVTPKILSPVSEGNTRPFHKRTRRLRESRHYQESDISTTVFHRSTVADKVSDYEDIWGPDNNNNSSLSTFKPPQQQSTTCKTSSFGSLDDTGISSKNNNRSPDLLERSSGSQFFTSGGDERNLLNKSPDLLERTSNSQFYVSSDEPLAELPLPINKNRFGLVFNTNVGTASLISPEIKSPCPEGPKSLDSNQPSPCYAEPADSIRQQAAALLRKKNKSGNYQPATPNNRHSDPPSLHHWHQQQMSSTAACGFRQLERIDSKEELITSSAFSSSVDNLISLRNSKRIIGGSQIKNSAIKPVDPPKVGQVKKRTGNASWTVDSSWEFFAEGCKTPSPSSSPQPTIDLPSPSQQRIITVAEIISQKMPKLSFSPVFIRISNTNVDHSSGEESPTSASHRIPAYDDNISIDNNNYSPDKVIYRNGMSVVSQISDTSDDANTEFSEPWDSSNWEHLLNKFDVTGDSFESNTQISRCKNFKERLDPLLSPPRLKALTRTRLTAGTGSAPGAAIRNYAFQLAADKDTVFARSIDNFIACTRESKEVKPQIVMRNMRQFMSGMKNYLLKHGEGEFEKEVEMERNKLKANEFMNLDAILEGVMHRLVIVPLKDHLYNLFVDQYADTGSIQQLADSISYARTRPAYELGFRSDKIIPPSEGDLEKVFECFQKLQTVDSPLEKLEQLLSAIAAIYHSLKVLNKGSEPIVLGADDFLPLFIWILVQSGMVAAEIEAEYMWGLLHPSLLSGEGGYYLTTLSSAVSVLKSFKQSYDKQQPNSTVPWCQDPLVEFRSVLKIVVPDEMNGSLLTKTLPVRPNMTTRDICKIIALKLRITNPQDYSLFKLVDGEETLLNDLDCPQDIKSESTGQGKHCIFAYKRIDAKIAWPRTTSPTQQ